MFVFQTGQVTNPRYIINFPTKRHWRGNSRMEDIESGLKALVDAIRQYNIRSIAIPPLGSGLGGLDWSEVKPRIEAALQLLTDVHVLLYELQSAPATEQMIRDRAMPNMTPGRAALIELMSRYLAGLLDPFVTLLEVHKRMYLMQEAGEPLQLEYQKGALTLLPGGSGKSAAFLDQYPDTRARAKKVTDLVEGFESPFGLDLLSTVHWIMKNAPVHSVEDVVQRTYAWNEHKRQFTPRQIALAAAVIAQKGWGKSLARELLYR